MQAAHSAGEDKTYPAFREPAVPVPQPGMCVFRQTRGTSLTTRSHRPQHTYLSVHALQQLQSHLHPPHALAGRQACIVHMHRWLRAKAKMMEACKVTGNLSLGTLNPDIKASGSGKA
eukprot:scaffold222076_cov18-Tisochrysis_lutea.AAC.1